MKKEYSVQKCVSFFHSLFPLFLLSLNSQPTTTACIRASRQNTPRIRSFSSESQSDILMHA